MDCLWIVFWMYHRVVGQVIFASWLATTFTTSDKSPSHSSTATVGEIPQLSELRADNGQTAPYCLLLRPESPYGRGARFGN